MNHRRKIVLYIGYLLLLPLFQLGCFHFEPLQSGIILDADTQRPIEDVIVLRKLCSTCYLPPNPGGPSCMPLAHSEVMTDKDGKYTLPIGINLLPPLACITDKPDIVYIKNGYFWGNQIDHPKKDVQLFQMTHYLNYLPLLGAKNYADYISSSWGLADISELFKKPELARLRYSHFEMADELGVFSRMPGRRLTRLFASNNSVYNIYEKKVFGRIIYFAYDDHGKEWIAIDGRGKQLDILPKDIPKFDFISLDESYKPYFVNSNELFYMTSNDNLLPTSIFAKFPYTMRKINLHEGNITGISRAQYTNVYTIENNGAELCQYGDAGRIDKAGNISPPHLISVLKTSDLPESGEDDSTNQSVFKHVTFTRSALQRLFIVTKTNKYWHIYCKSLYDTAVRDKADLTKIYSFPSEREITAFDANGVDLFIAFENEGLRAYTITNYSDYPANFVIKENAQFNKNAKMAKVLNINSIALGTDITNRAIYAVTGEDKIYRFALDGTPDFIIWTNGIDKGNIQKSQPIGVFSPKEVDVNKIPKDAKKRNRPTKVGIPPKVDCSKLPPPGSPGMAMSTSDLHKNCGIDIKTKETESEFPKSSPIIP